MSVLKSVYICGSVKILLGDGVWMDITRWRWCYICGCIENVWIIEFKPKNWLVYNFQIKVNWAFSFNRKIEMKIDKLWQRVIFPYMENWLLV